MVFWMVILVLPWPIGSDDLEIARQFPVGDVAAELALLPFAGGGEMLDEIVAEQLARRGRALEALRRLPQGGRQGRGGIGRQGIGVADDGRRRLELVLDPPQA